jgi:hypothetical protein
MVQMLEKSNPNLAKVGVGESLRPLQIFRNWQKFDEGPP